METIRKQLKEAREALARLPKAKGSKTWKRARREYLLARIRQLEEILRADEERAAKAAAEAARAEAARAREAAIAAELKKAPRCVILDRFRDEDGNPIPEIDVLAKAIGEMDPQNPLVTYQDYGGCGSWVAHTTPMWPDFQPDQVPQQVKDSLAAEAEREYTEWKSLIGSLVKREEVVISQYFGDDDEIKWSETRETYWVSPDGKKYEFLPPAPRSAESRIEVWWYSKTSPSVESLWLAKAREFLCSLGWEIR